MKFYYDVQSLPGAPTGYSRGTAIGRLVAQTYGTGTNGDYFGYDNLGRVTRKYQQIGTKDYKVEATYNRTGAIVQLKYPSERIVNHAYDPAGRLNGVDGNLGGCQRTYSTGIIYSPSGGMTKEEFGTNTAIYNKLFYNSRGQLAEIRASTSYIGPTDYSADRGAIVNYYSTNCTTATCSGESMPDNNGNLRKQEIHIPGQTMRYQEYSYDSLNRLEQVSEAPNGGAPHWKQTFIYDRWGNRRIDTDPLETFGTGINNKDFEVIQANNRLAMTPGQSGVMEYDAAGNLTNDTYTGAGNRTYDAENKITSAWGRYNQAQLYKYDGSGQRIKRTVDGVETWQVYGLGGELVAEYPANGAAASPQKEYGYRNGQLLITAELPRTNLALAANGATANSASQVSGNYPASSTINSDRRGLNWNNGGGWNDGTVNTHPDWLQIDFNGSKTIDEISVFTLQDNPATPAEPTESMTFTLYGLTGYSVQYWNGSVWTTVPGGSVTGNNKIWRKFTFSPITTTKIRVLTSSSPDGYSRITEVEAWGYQAPPPRTNFALAGLTSASSTINANYPAVSTINGDRRGLNWNNGGGWNDATVNTHPDWLEIDFNGSKTIDEISVFTLQDNPATPAEPTESMTFTLYGLTGYSVQYWIGSSWITVPGGSVTGNSKVWRKFTFSPITTSKIRVLTNASVDGYSRVTEVEAWGPTETGAFGGVKWLVVDHLGTPRMIFDQTGDLATMTRHDYLPFGEELFAATGGRTTGMGYSGGDGVRQQFTAYERDVETGLDYAQARYYSSTQGRFSSPDPLLSSGRVTEPQSWNRYNYCSNNPLNIIDPTGLDWWYLKDSERQTPVWFDQDPGTDYERWTNTFDYVYYDSAAGKYAVLDPTSNFAFTTNTLERANELFDTYFAGWLGMGGQAEGEFLGGLGSGASPFGIFIDQINASAGMDTTSRDYLTGKVLGSGLGGGVGILGSVFKGAGAGSTLLNKGLASESQAAQVAAGQGIPILGAGTDKVLTEAPRLAAQYGGLPSNWSKVSSWSYKAADGSRFEIHAYQNLATGKIVEYKTKFPD